MLGFPGETKEQMQETIAYAKALGADWCVFNIATPLTGTEMYEQFLNLGYIHDDIDVWSKALYQERHFDTKEISAKELKELAYRENLEINFIHNPNMTGGNFNRAIEIFNDIVIKYPFHIIGWYCLMQCYQNLKDFAKMKQIDRKIRDLIKSDARSTKMFHNYKDLMSDFKLSPDETTGVLFSRERL
jgi:tetratricopeptide (TPR) repeat protein